MTTREQRLTFGEVADDYDDVRADYPAELVNAVVAYAGVTPAHIVESGAGTGKATTAFAALGTRMTCVEPDPQMAAVLSAKVAGDARIEVVVSRFEDWTPPAGGVDLVVSAQAWHWVTPETRLALAHAALRPGGVLALCGHSYNFADDDVRAALDEVYVRLFPDSPVRGFQGGNTQVVPESAAARMPAPSPFWLSDEMVGSEFFTDQTTTRFRRIVPYSTHDFVRLLNTYSPHRMLPDDQRADLFTALAAVVDVRGGVVRHQIDTVLALGRAVS